MDGAATRFPDAIAFEARGHVGVGSRRPRPKSCRVLIAATLCAGLVVVAGPALVGVHGSSGARSSATGGLARLPVPLGGVVCDAWSERAGVLG